MWYMVAMTRGVIVTHWLDDFRESSVSSYRSNARQVVLQIGRIVPVSNIRRFVNEPVGDESCEVVA